MRIKAALLAVSALLAWQLPSVAVAQAPAGVQPLVGTWLLSGLERAAPGQPLARVMNPVGMLIQSANGYVLQIVSQSARPATLDASEQFMTYRAFWGTFTVDPNGAKAAYHIEGDFDPGRKDQRFISSFERKGTELVLTEQSADGKPMQRTTWVRLPELEALPEYQEGVVGIWQWTGAGLYDATGDNVRPASRDPSIIVYTPTGHMAVLYLPPPGRKPFVGPTPTVEEARAAWQGSVSYFGTYIVQPKTRTMFHYQMAAANPTAVGGWFMRNFEVNGSQVKLIFPPTMLNGQQVRNTLTLKRLAGVTEMWPEFRR
jgi:Lipocalin-like domain